MRPLFYQAVIDGDWLLFEDIDTATNDVVTLLVSLIERNSLNVPGYRDNLIPAPGFQIFFTQRLELEVCNCGPQDFGM